jgi:hypothetical protein
MQATLSTRENAHHHAGTRIAITDVFPAGWPFQRGAPLQPHLAAAARDPHERKEADDGAPPPQPQPETRAVALPRGRRRSRESPLPSSMKKGIGEKGRGLGVRVGVVGMRCGFSGSGA